MRKRQLIWRDLYHYRWQVIAIALAVSLTVAVVTASLLTGNSVRQTLLRQASEKLNGVKTAIKIPHGTMRSDAVKHTTGQLQLNSFISHSDGKFANKINLYGLKNSIPANEIHLNEAIANALNIKLNDTIVVKTLKPSFLSQSFVLSTSNQSIYSWRLKVSKINQNNFSLEHNQRQAFNGFVNLNWLNEKLDLENRCNLFTTTQKLSSSAIKANLRLTDFGCYVTDFPEQSRILIRSNEGFIPNTVAQAFDAYKPQKAFTWFVNELSAGTSTTPFSFVAGVEDREIADDEIIVNQWLADDLKLKVGDSLKISYFEADLSKKSAQFKVKNIIPTIKNDWQRAFMPNFPGLSDSESCSDWDSELPIDLDKVREKDEAYWDDYSGTPKAFISLKTAQKLWKNRFGDVTAITLPIEFKNQVENIFQKSLQNLDILPQIVINEVEKTGQLAAEKSVDFTSLFLGLSFFIIVAGLILMSTVINLFLADRKYDIGVMKSCGHSNSQIKSLLFTEIFIVIIVGVLDGLIYGTLCCYGTIYLLNTAWSGAVGTAQLQTYISPTLLAITAIGITLFLLLFSRILLNRFIKREIIELTNSKIPVNKKSASWQAPLFYGVIILSFLSANTVPTASQNAMGGFIGIGMLALLGLNGRTLLILRRAVSRINLTTVNQKSFIIRNITRNTVRSMSVIALLSLGIFLTVAVGINRKGLINNPYERSSGTGGFSLFIDTTLPLKSIDFDQPTVAFRRQLGTSADCQNLNKVLLPTIIGCQPKELSSRGAFTFLDTLENNDESPWEQLDSNDEIIPFVTDFNAAMWILQMKIGDTLEYQVASGKTYLLKLVGGIENSVLQGNIIISEKNFLKLFPNSDGYNLFLSDIEPNNLEGFTEKQSRNLRNFGVEIEPTDQRLNRFNIVQNTYLQIFLVLGGLGVVLGIIGTFITIFRNIQERKNEIDWFISAGFSSSQIRQQLFLENSFLLKHGLINGTLAALVVIIPILRSPAGTIPWLNLALLYICIVITTVLLFKLLIKKIKLS